MHSNVVREASNIKCRVRTYSNILKMKKPLTIPSYSFEDTSDKNIKRFVDRDGNWTHYWLVKEKRFVKAVNHILHLGYNKGARFQEYLLSVSKEEAKKKLETAGNEGTRTHRAIGDLIKGIRITTSTKYPSDLNNGRQEPLTDDEWDNLQAFENWCVKYNPRLVDQEQTVASTDFAGTFDALLIITVPSGDKTFAKEVWGQDILILIDWKSSAGIWDEYEAQLAAYWEAISMGSKYRKFANAFHGKIYSGIVRIGTKHKAKFEFQVWDSMQTAYNILAFNAAQTIANKYETEFKPEIELLKIDFSIKVPKAKVPKATKSKLTKKVLGEALEQIGDNLEEQPKLPLGDKKKK